MSDPLDGLGAIDWHDLGGAYGSPDAWPALLRAASTGDSDAWDRLWGTVWHQGTVYEGTSSTVPFLVGLAIRREGDESGRSQAGFLLGAIAAATSFVLPGEPGTMLLADWLRQPGSPVPARDLVHECNAAVAAHALELANALNGASPAVRAGLLAALAAVGATLPQAAQTVLAPLVTDPDAFMSAAARLTLALAAGTLTGEGLRAAAGTDDDAADYLETINDWPQTVRAVELARVLCWRVGSSG